MKIIIISTIALTTLLFSCSTKQDYVCNCDLSYVKDGQEVIIPNYVQHNIFDNGNGGTRKDAENICSLNENAPYVYAYENNQSLTGITINCKLK